jgi:hypothetical protein
VGEWEPPEGPVPPAELGLLLGEKPLEGAFIGAAGIDRGAGGALCGAAAGANWAGAC